MAKEVFVIFNEDGEQWARYLQDQLSNPQTVNASVFLQKDTALFSGTIDTRSETRILKASAVIVIVTPGHMDFMISKRQATYDKICPAGDKSLLFFAGLSEDKITENSVIKYTKRIFPCFDCWSKVTYVDTESIRELLEKTVDIMDRPDPIQSKFTLFPSTVLCEEETKVVAIIDQAIHEKAKVRAIIRGTYTDEDIPCERLNNHAYTFVVPSHVEDKATVYLSVNKRSLGSQAEIHFKSYISCSDQTAVSEIYCHLLDRLCFFLQNHCKNVCSTKDIDNTLSDIFNHTVDLPAVGYEKLFGIYQYFTEEQSRTMVPTLVHLAANYNLQELVANLQGLPYFTNAICITNKEMKRPTEIAVEHGNNDLAEFLQDKEEEAERYILLVYGEGSTYAAYYNKRLQNIKDRSHSEMSNYYSLDSEDNYADMSGSQNKQTSTFDNGDLILLKEKLQRGELGPEEAEREFMKWQRKYMTNDLDFQAKKAMMKTILEDLKKITGQSMRTQPQLPEYRQAGREPIPPPIPSRNLGARSPSKPISPHDAGKPHSYLELRSKPMRESGELYDYADTNDWIFSQSSSTSPLRRDSGSARSSRTSTSSRASSGRGSLASVTDDECSRFSNRLSTVDLNLPPPPPIPKRASESTNQPKKRW